MSASPPAKPRLYDRRRERWFWIDNVFVDEKIDEVPPRRRAHALAIYAILARHANPEGVGFPGLAHLQKRTGLSRPTVLDALKALTEVGAIAIRTTWRSDGGRGPNSYELQEINPPVKESKPPVKEVDPPSKRHYPQSIPDPPPKGNAVYPKNTKKEEDVTPPTSPPDARDGARAPSEVEAARALNHQNETEADIKRKLDAELEADPLGGRLAALIAQRKDETKNGRVRASTLWGEFIEPLATLRESYGEEAIADGLDQAIRSEKPNMSWVAKAAARYRAPARGGAGGDLAGALDHLGRQQADKEAAARRRREGYEELFDAPAGASRKKRKAPTLKKAIEGEED